MKNLTFILLGFLLFSCAQSNFAKRKYTKGVYVEKRGHAANKKIKTKRSDVEARQLHLSNEQTIAKLNQKESKPVVDNTEEKASSNSVPKDQITNKEPIEIKSNRETSDSEVIDKAEKEKNKKKVNNGTSSIIIGSVALTLTAIASYFMTIFILYGVLPLYLMIVIPIFALGIASLVLGVIAYKKGDKKKGKIGIILSSITLLILLAFTVFALILWF